MKNLSKYFNSKCYFIICVTILFLLIVLFYFLNTKIKYSISTILEVDSDKNFLLNMDTANLTQINESKKIVLILEGKYYILEEVELIYLGHNKYNIVFSNDNLFKIVKNNSLYRVNVVLGSKTLLDTIFNI